MDLAAIQGAVQGVNAALNTIKSLYESHVSAEVDKRLSGVVGQLIEAQSFTASALAEQATMIGRIRELEEKIQRLETWATEKERYALKEIRPHSFAYVLKESMANGEPPHRLCAACYQQGVKAILYKTGEITVRSHALTCPKCETTMPMFEGVPELRYA